MNVPFRHYLLPALAAAVWLSAPCADARIFTTLDGRFIDGEVSSVNQGQVIIRSSDGHQATVALQQLVSPDRALIETWVKSHSPAPASTPAPTANYSFDVTFNKEKVGSSVGSRSKHVKETRNKYVTHITVMNKSRQAADGIELHYQIHYNVAEGKNSLERHKDGVVKLPTIPSAGTATVDTDTIDLDITELAGGRYYKDGSSPRQYDSYRGIAATFVRDGKEIFEFVSPGITKGTEQPSQGVVKPKAK